ncbi:MBL fold metallo-hydrolase [Roseixanthobacter liquoris]|uniref:MBL fold metallo-hydrolase n=1 Tax=Roseixanthobacter liquoris TaxID=3119921 RepID=UPI00372B9249
MADELLIRVYDVGLGDCIFCRIPGAMRVDGAAADFHMLIDCGSWSGGRFLEAALKDLATLLPDTAGGKKRLDLLVITHEHKDHIAGCDPKLFAPFKIGAIWMNAAMDPDHPQAKGTQKLHAVALAAMRGLTASGLALSPQVQDLADMFGIDNDGAMAALREGLPKANAITPRYVEAGKTNADYGLPLTGAAIHVLGPEADIDRFYLGKTAPAAHAFSALSASGALDAPAPSPPSADAPSALPANIAAADFRQLRSRMLSSALAFAALSSKVTNNSSVVLLVEWRGKRLLFVGDAEWDEPYKEGKSNGAWNVMWNQRRQQLGGALDFLKIGHHGSENATPWADGAAGDFPESTAILDAILPLPAPGAAARAFAVASTERSKYKTIPRTALLAEIGRRVGNGQNYQDRFQAVGKDVSAIPKYRDFEHQDINAPQPQRTDLERILTGSSFVDVILTA